MADDFIKKLSDRCAEAEDGLSYSFAADFINELLQAIGLQCNFTGDHIEHHTAKEYPWPLRQMHIYSFRYRRWEFHRFELFLFKVATTIAEHQQAHIAALQQSIEEGSGEEQCLISFLLECATRTLAIWCNAFHYLKSFEPEGSIRHFDEPLARISKRRKKLSPKTAAFQKPSSSIHLLLVLL